MEQSSAHAKLESSNQRSNIRVWMAIGVSLIVMCLSCGGGYKSISQINDEAEATARESLKVFDELVFGLSDNKFEVKDLDWYLEGKLLVASRDHAEIRHVDGTFIKEQKLFKIGEHDRLDGVYKSSPLTNILPKHLIPSTPDEVGSVLLIDYYQDQVASYGAGKDHGAIGYRERWEVTLVNLGKKFQFSSTITMNGPEPPPTIEKTMYRVRAVNGAGFFLRSHIDTDLLLERIKELPLQN